MATVATINVGEVVHKMTLRVTGQQQLAIRGWLAMQVIKLAAIILGSRLSVDLQGGDDFDERDLPITFDGEGYRDYVQVGGYSVPTACSVREGSPLYESSFVEWGQHVDVYLDGVRQSEVVSFDIKGGWLRRFKKDAHGNLAKADDELATEVLRGAIELRPV